MLDRLKYDVIAMIARVRVENAQEMADMEALERQQIQQRLSHSHYQHQPSDPAAYADGESQADSRATQESEQEGPGRLGPKIGRNDPCPCGSGKKFKHCHGRLQ